jgi:hypothetical protein
MFTAGATGTGVNKVLYLLSFYANANDFTCIFEVTPIEF